MGYSDFTDLEKLRSHFDLTLEEDRNLFPDLSPIAPSHDLQTSLEEYLPLATAINTEKARSEFLIAPILAEVRRQSKYQVSLFSGTEFNVDRDRGLTGFCDYILSLSKEQYYIRVPVTTIVEAKNENIKGGLGQCIAAMVAAQIFNQQNDRDIATIFGAVTTGTTWKFLTLAERTVNIDRIEYYIDRVDKILAILLSPLQT